jgi:hypothetical protein
MNFKILPLSRTRLPLVQLRSSCESHGIKLPDGLLEVLFRRLAAVLCGAAISHSVSGRQGWARRSSTRACAASFLLDSSSLTSLGARSPFTSRKPLRSSACRWCSCGPGSSARAERPAPPPRARPSPRSTRLVNKLRVGRLQGVQQLRASLQSTAPQASMPPPRLRAQPMRRRWPLLRRPARPLPRRNPPHQSFANT